LRSNAIPFFIAEWLTPMPGLKALAAWMKRNFKRVPRITLRHLHEHQILMHEALMQVLENQNSQSRHLEKFMASLKERLDAIETGIDDVSAQQTAVSTQLTKAQAEIEKEVADLRALVEAGGGNTPEITAKLDSIDAKVSALKGISTQAANVAQALDDLNPDPTP
jgi:chromosome segregation ATPase